jgi:uncharacterized membrane protein YidH (DUF202 family)
VNEGLDPTRASERTLLAWNRSALAIAVVAALAIRAGAVRDSVGAYVLGGLMLIFAVVVLAQAGTAYRTSRRQMAAGEGVSRPRAIRATAAATAVTGVAAFAVALLS